MQGFLAITVGSADSYQGAWKYLGLTTCTLPTVC
jgi:hypothetical protein